MIRQVYKTLSGGGQGFSSWSAVEFSSTRKNSIVRSGAASVKAYGIWSGGPAFGSRMLFGLGSSRPVSVSVAAGDSQTGSFGGLLGAMALALGMALVAAEEREVALGELVTLDWLGFLVGLASLALG